MQLFYNQEIQSDTTLFTFPKEESKHIIRVLRKSVGDILKITNGKGWLLDAEIIHADIKKCKIMVTKVRKQPNRPYTLHLAVAPTKMNDRFEWFLEKATEIGIDAITPIICEHSERHIIKINRFRKILQSAMKQSQQSYLPTIHELTTFSSFVKIKNQDSCFIAHCENSKKHFLKAVVKPGSSTTILIGPEGDFSTNEIQMALKHKFIPVSLGSSRLRTETAAVVACHSIAFINV